MRLIDLYNRYVNSEEMPKKVKVDKKIYVYDYANNDYYCEEIDKYLMDIMNTLDSLNTEIEIMDIDKVKTIEDKSEKIEPIRMVGCNIDIEVAGKRTFLPTETLQYEVAINKINEIIDRLNELLEKSD